ncbi:MAG: LysM peptidoglycan-binding domain-containing protein [Chloroflexi bacterium]|nr:LysM peptidoglycan-binding domain-containing protein [Chloroflexota bacterium]
MAAMEEGGDGAEEQPTPPQPPRGNRTWVWVVLGLLAVAAIGVLLGSRLGGLTGPLSSQAGGNGRPTIVVATTAAAPSVAVTAPSPSAVPSSVVAGATAVAATQYVVQPGDTLRSIAEAQYGDAGQWPRIYDANRDAIGSNPDALVAGTTLQIPPPQ